jgi:hypothetical protein
MVFAQKASETQDRHGGHSGERRSRPDATHAQPDRHALGEWKVVEQQSEELNNELERISASDAGCTRIRQIPGSPSNGQWQSSLPSVTGIPFVREFAAWLGIVPRQYSGASLGGGWEVG